MLRSLEKNSEVSGQRLKIITWNPVKAGGGTTEKGGCARDGEGVPPVS